MTWNASATALKKQGVPVEFMKPKEGDAYLGMWIRAPEKRIPRHVDLAYDLTRLPPENQDKAST